MKYEERAKHLTLLEATSGVEDRKADGMRLFRGSVPLHKGNAEISSFIGFLS